MDAFTFLYGSRIQHAGIFKSQIGFIQDDPVFRNLQYRYLFYQDLWLPPDFWSGLGTNASSVCNLSCPLLLSDLYAEMILPLPADLSAGAFLWFLVPLSLLILLNLYG